MDKEILPSTVAGAPSAEATAPTLSERLHEFRGTLRRHWLIIVFVVLLVAGAAVALSATSVEKYDATAKLLLRQNEPIEALLGRTSAGGVDDPERETNTKVALIKLETIADRVGRNLRLEMSADQLLDEVSTEVEGNSDIVAITVRDRDPRRAAAIANAFAEQYVAFRRESGRAGINEAAALARSRLRSLSETERASAEGRGLEARLRELEIASSLQTGGAEVVRRAIVPTSAATPRPVRSALIGLFLGLMLALLIVALLEFIDRRLRDEDEAQSVLKLPILATIPKPARGGSSVNATGDRDAEEGYGTLAANVTFSSRTQELSVLMVTSSRSGDGKTSVSLGLARALRMLGQRVIVIEADLHHPIFVHILNIEQKGGLSSLLAGVGKLDDELVVLDGPNGSRSPADGHSSGGSFSLLPAGPVPPNPSAMLSRPAMGRILDECRSRADFVIIDTAPVGLVHDPLSLINHVDGILVVTRLQWTNRDTARRTVRLLGQVGAPLLGVVLTGGERTSGQYYGDADYRHYGRPKEKTSARPRSRTKARNADARAKAKAKKADAKEEKADAKEEKADAKAEKADAPVS